MCVYIQNANFLTLARSCSSEAYLPFLRTASPSRKFFTGSVVMFSGPTLNANGNDEIYTNTTMLWLEHKSNTHIYGYLSNKTIKQTYLQYFKHT